MQYEQRTYESGEVSPDHLWRADLKARATSAKRIRNMRITIGGALENRPGSSRLATLDGDGWVVDMTVDDVAYMLVLTAENLKVYRRSDRVQIANLTAAWTAGVVPGLVVAPYGSDAFVTALGMPPQKITRSPAGVWSVGAATFGSGIGGSIRQLYYRFADPGVTLTPNGVTGSITLTASAATFVAGHVGTRFRLQKREVEITAVASGTSATATVIQRLLPTVTLPVTSSAGFSVGEVVTGKDSSAEAEVVGVPSSTSLTLLLQKFTDFLWDGTKGETIVGPSATTTNTAAQTATTNAAVLDWDEQAISAVRGYPGTAAVHKGRLWLGRFPQVPFGIAASAQFALDDFSVGENDADAFFEELGNEAAGAVRHIMPSEQLLVMTSRKLFYYPESESNPIRPTAFQLIEVGPDGANNCRPVAISEGVVYAEEGGGSLLGAFPTGDVRRSWRTADVTQLSAHLVSNPRSLAYVSGQAVGPERYVYAVNDTGELVVVYYSDGAEVFGVVRWETDGDYRSVAAVDGEAWAIVRRSVNGSDVFFLEVIDPARFMDAAVTVGSGAYQGLATTETILTPSGPMPADKVYRFAALANATCDLMVGDSYIGQVELDGDGDFGVPDVAGAIQIGRRWESAVEPWPVVDASDDRNRRRKMRITRAHVRWKGRYLAIDGKLQPAYRGGEDANAAPPLRDELTSAPCFRGWAYEPFVTFTHPYPGPFTLLGHSLEVAR